MHSKHYRVHAMTDDDEDDDLGSPLNEWDVVQEDPALLLALDTQAHHFAGNTNHGQRRMTSTDPDLVLAICGAFRAADGLKTTTQLPPGAHIVLAPKPKTHTQMPQNDDIEILCRAMCGGTTRTKFSASQADSQDDDDAHMRTPSRSRANATLGVYPGPHTPPPNATHTQSRNIICCDDLEALTEDSPLWQSRTLQSQVGAGIGPMHEDDTYSSLFTHSSIGGGGTNPAVSLGALSATTTRSSMSCDTTAPLSQASVSFHVSNNNNHNQQQQQLQSHKGLLPSGVWTQNSSSSILSPMAKVEPVRLAQLLSADMCLSGADDEEENSAALLRLMSPSWALPSHLLDFRSPSAAFARSPSFRRPIAF